MSDLIWAWLYGLIVFAIFIVLTGCSQLSTELVEALAKDSASICLKSSVSGGGAGMVAGPPGMIPAGGYGQAELLLCRSNQPGSKLTINPDGSILIEQGRGDMLIEREHGKVD